MTASEKLTQLIENDKLTDDQLDNLNGWGIQQVAELKDYLVNKIKELEAETDSIDALSALCDYKDDDYVVYYDSRVTKLDYDTLMDSLNDIVYYDDDYDY